MGYDTVLIFLKKSCRIADLCDRALSFNTDMYCISLPGRSFCISLSVVFQNIGFVESSSYRFFERQFESMGNVKQGSSPWDRMAFG